MKKFLLTILLIPTLVSGQGTVYKPGQVLTFSDTIPPTCTIGSIFILSTNGSMFVCRTIAGSNIFLPVAATIVPAKVITGLQNGVATPVLTFTVPNIASGAIVEVTLSGSLGAGGAIGQYEATIGRTILISLTRTPGLDTDTGIMTAGNAVQSRVTGATTIAQVTSLSAISGPTSGTQTFNLQYQLSRGGGASNNHIASVTARIISPTLTSIAIQ